MFALRLFRLGILAAVLAATFEISKESPTIGFAVMSAVIAFAITARMEYERLTVDRAFLWAGRPASKLVALPLSILSSLGLALVVGVAALFTFADPDAMRGLNADLAEQFRVDNLAKLKVLIGTILISVFIALGFDRFTTGNGHRWAMYQLAGLFGILFSFGIQLAASAYSQANQAPPIALQPYADASVLKLIVNSNPGVKDCEEILLGEFDKAWRINRCGRNMNDKTRENCKKKEKDPAAFVNYGCLERSEEICRRINNGHGEWIDRTKEAWVENSCGRILNTTNCENSEKDSRKWTNFGCGQPKGTLTLAQAIVIFSVLEDYLNEKVVDAIERYSPHDMAWRKQAVTIAPVFISSNLAQGVVVACYVALIMIFVFRRKVS